MTDTAPEATSERRLRLEIARRFVRAPLAWGVLLLIAAMVRTIAGDDLSFFPFLLMLLGGWSVAFSFAPGLPTARTRGVERGTLAP
ncbi:hypothetical protein [Microbacterium sp. K2]|uniref:hypothetical protein n=1 Tax=Microbacterium sp. K2 TaxID=3391827 RepID=UPI003ED99EF1